jgi:very-short-patch-repair endonuclease
MSGKKTLPRPPSPTVTMTKPLAPPLPLAGEGREGVSPHGKNIETGRDQPNWLVQPRTRAHARTLRQDMTKAERIIWYAVRGHRLDGASFRRQTPIGPYIVDFVSHTAKLVIEIDGGQHFEDRHEARDARRDAYLTSKGYRVLRFSNLDVVANRDGVVSVIAAAVLAARAPTLPSPASGRGGASGLGGEPSL